MYARLVRFCRGSVRFRVPAAGADALWNEAIQQQIRFWRIRQRGAWIEGNVAAREYLPLCRIARRLGLRPRIQAKTGIPFYWNRLWKRKGLVIGLAGCVIGLLLSQNFIWEIEIRDYDGGHQDYLMEVMEEHGIRIGAYHPALDFRTLQQEILMDLEDISWLALNRKGTVLEVEVSEKVMPPELRETHPCNVVARRSGQITGMDVYLGREMVSVQEAVSQGDLLVSGIIEDEMGHVRQVHADARVMAKTVRTHTIRFALTQQEKELLPSGTRRTTLEILGRRIPLYFDFSLPYPADLTEQKTPLILLGTEYPVSVIQEEYQYYQTVERVYSREEGQQIIQEAFSRYEQEELGEVSILSYRDRQEEKDGILSVTREYQCEENIAAKMQLSINE